MRSKTVFSTVRHHPHFHMCALRYVLLDVGDPLTNAIVSLFPFVFTVFQVTCAANGSVSLSGYAGHHGMSG